FSSFSFWNGTSERTKAPRKGAQRQPGEAVAYAGVQRGGDQRKPPERHLRWPPRDGYSGAPGSTRHKRVVIRPNFRSNLFAPEARVEIEQIKLSAGAGDRGVQPAHVFAIDHFLGDITLIDEDG